MLQKAQTLVPQKNLCSYTEACYRHLAEVKMIRATIAVGAPFWNLHVFVPLCICTYCSILANRADLSLLSSVPFLLGSLGFEPISPMEQWAGEDEGTVFNLTISGECQDSAFPGCRLHQHGLFNRGWVVPKLEFGFSFCSPLEETSNPISWGGAVFCIHI